jgi:hypothetical protein
VHFRQRDDPYRDESSGGRDKQHPEPQDGI